MEGATVTESGRVGAEPEAKRIDIISDTHGHLSPALLEQLEGADLIIHAGDITSEMDWEHLCTIAPIRGVLGNNGVSIHQVLQKPAVNGVAELVVVTDQVENRHLNDALVIFEQMSMIREVASVIRVYTVKTQAL